ncbi:MAG: hypothetical protein NXI22_23980, partial [bacterium]|nr:hypothetical protein [bacterium]
SSPGLIADRKQGVAITNGDELPAHNAFDSWVFNVSYVVLNKRQIRGSFQHQESTSWKGKYLHYTANFCGF